MPTLSHFTKLLTPLLYTLQNNALFFSLFSSQQGGHDSSSSFLFFSCAFLFLTPLVWTVPLQRGRLFIREEIARLVRAQKIMLLHLHVLRRKLFLELETVHRRRGGQKARTLHNPRRWNRRVVGTVVVVVGILFVQDRAGVAVGRPIFETPQNLIALVKAFVTQLLGLGSKNGGFTKWVTILQCYHLFLHRNIAFSVALFLQHQPWFQFLYLPTQQTNLLILFPEKNSPTKN